MNTNSWKTTLLEGAVFIILGCVAIIVPQLVTSGLEILIGVLLVVAGLAQILRALKGPGVVFPTITGVVALIAGILLLAYPWAGTKTLTIVLTIYFFIGGVIRLYMAYFLRRTAVWFWYFLSGAVGLILAGIIWAGFPATASWVLGLLLGIDLLFFGCARVALALVDRSPRP